MFLALLTCLFSFLPLLNMYTHSLFSSFVLSLSLTLFLTYAPSSPSLRRRGDARRQLKGAELTCHFSHNSITASRQHARTRTRAHIHTHTQAHAQTRLHGSLSGEPIDPPLLRHHSVPVNYGHFTGIKTGPKKKELKRFRPALDILKKSSTIK